jgi:four helix bundle protein
MGIQGAPNPRMARDHRKLAAFELADELTLRIYRITQCFPREETYGLRAQLRRAALSIPSNIVEGCGRDTEREYVRFLEIAFASTREVIYLVGLAARLQMVDAKSTDEVELFAGRVAAALAALRKSRS